MREGREEIDPEGHATDLFSQWAVDYLTERKPAQQPFMLFLSYNAPHTPIQPPQDWLAKVKAREQGITEKRAKIVALIEHLDEGVGRVMEALEANGLREKTLVVFTSDNGGQANVGARNAPWRGEKQEMWEGGLRVPTCAVWPGKIKPGTRYDGTTMTMDWLPTLAEIGGGTAPAGIEGRSLAGALLRGEAGPAADRTLFWVRLEGGAKYGGRAYYAARKGDWKLLQNTANERPFLVNLAKDPGETEAVGAQAKVRRGLESALQEHIRKAGFVPWQGRDPDLEKVE
jgi:arylsulfatase A-like enzyme